MASKYLFQPLRSNGQLARKMKGVAVSALTAALILRDHDQMKPAKQCDACWINSATRNDDGGFPEHP